MPGDSRQMKQDAAPPAVLSDRPAGALWGHAEVVAWALLAGLIFGLAEWVRFEVLARSGPSSVYSRALLGATTIGASLLLAIAMGVWQVVLRLVHRRLDRGPRLWRQALFLAVWPALNLTVLFGLALVSVMRLPWTLVAAWLAGIVGACVGALVIRWLARRNGPSWLRLVFVVSLVCGATLCWWLNNAVLPRQNHTIHLALSIVSLAALQVGGLLTFAGRAHSMYRRLVTAGLVLTLGLCAWLQTSLPGAHGVKHLVFDRGDATWRTLTMAAAVVDWDRDGYSAFLVGADCDDGDATVYPAAPTTTADCLQRWHPHVTPLPEATTVVSPAPTPGQQFERRRRSVLVLSIDALRADRMSMYGYQRNTSPHMDALSKSGIAGMAHLTQAPGTKFTFKSFASMLLPDTVDRLQRQGKRVPTVLPVLHDAGYHTTFISPVPKEFATTVVRDVGQWHRPQTDDEAVKMALSALQDATKGRPFVWLHLWGPHHPYKRLDDVDDYGSTPSDIYDENVVGTDRRIGRLFAELKRRGILSDLVVLLTADHGEEFGEHGGDKHGLSLHRELLAVPLVIWLPGVQGMRWTTPTRTVDLAATLLDVVGIAPDIKWRTEGRSLLPWMLARQQPPQLPQVAWIPRSRAWHHVALRRDDCVLIYNLKLRAMTVYDRRTDPGELHNLVGSDTVAGRCRPDLMLGALMGHIQRPRVP